MRTTELLSYFALSLAAPACSSQSRIPGLCDSTPVTVTVPLSRLMPPDGGSLTASPPINLLDATAEDASAGEVGADAGADAAPPAVGDKLPYDVCERVCPEEQEDCQVTTVANGEITLSCTIVCFGGRRPAGYRGRVFGDTTPLGDHFATQAALEEVSVGAFRWLSDDLAAHGAPRALVRACRHAARDEIRHARAMRSLSRRHGGSPAAPLVRRRKRPSLEEIARENAVEGCVRETFGALVAHWQARSATDAGVRAAMKKIALDETRHAALSFSIDAWARSRLTREARARVEGARREAIRELRPRASSEERGAWTREAGLPSASEARALAESLEKTLFRPRTPG